MYSLPNRSGSAAYKTASGGTVTDANMNIDGGAVKNIDATDKFSRSEWQEGTKRTTEVVGGLDGISAADLQLITTVDTTSLDSSGFVLISLGDELNTLRAGQFVVIHAIAYRIIEVISGTQILVSATDSTLFDALDPVYQVEGSFAEQDPTNFIYRDNPEIEVHSLGLTPKLKRNGTQSSYRVRNKLSHTRATAYNQSYASGLMNPETNPGFDGLIQVDEYPTYRQDKTLVGSGQGLLGQYAFQDGSNTIKSGNYTPKGKL